MACTMHLLYGFFVSALIIFVCKLFNKSPAPIFGIYEQPNKLYWFKVLFMYSTLLIKKILQRLSPKGQEFYNKLDTVQKLDSAPLAVDAVYFNGANKNGDYLNLGTARRPNRLVDGFLFLKLKSCEYGLLQHPKLPDSSFFNSGEEESYEAEGIKVAPLEPMKKWRITYNGQLKEAHNDQKLHNVSIDAIYTSDEPCYNYETDMDPWSMAKALAYEKWSKSFFENIKKTHHFRYEQFGNMKANIKVDDQEYNIELDATRDHSIAKCRDWATFRRYAFHWVTAENGDHFAIGSLCMPVTYSRLKIGYMYKAHDRKMYAVTSSDLELYRYGEMGNPPKDYAFTFRAGNTDYAMQVNIIEAPHFYISKQWEAKLYECLCTIEVNGIKGHGGVEWVYRNVEGRNVDKENK